MSEIKSAKKTTAKKTTAKATAAQLGSLVKATTVVRPDGSEITVEGGIYVLDVQGVFTIDGKKLEVK